MSDTSSADILANPSEHTVEQVLSAFEAAAPEDIANTQALEAAGKGRKSITEYALPVPDAEPRFARERVLHPIEGPRITGLKFSVIAGALDGDDSDTFSRPEVAAKAEAFLPRVPHPVDEDEE